MGNYGRLKVWYVPDSITNIFLMHKLETLYWITYDSWEGYLLLYMPRGQVEFFKDEQELPYVDLKDPGHEAAIMLLQNVGNDQRVASDNQAKIALVQTVSAS